MKASQLRASILQQAVEGKLVPQIPEEGTAADLLKSIRAEREALIKAGKIKRSKPLPEITEDEIPFEIPESWEWVRLGDICTKLTDGAHRTPKYTERGVPFVSVKDMSSGKLSLSNTKYISPTEHQELILRCNPEYGDLLISKVGTTGIPAIVDTYEEFSLFVSVALMKFSQHLLDVKYLYYLIYSPLVAKQAKDNTKGIGNQNWVVDKIQNTLVVLPPLAEQKRIVAKLEELMPLIDAYEKEEEKLSALEKSLPEKLRRSVLQQAVEGKLVPQRAEEGTAAELLKEIEKERAELVKAGKMKKAKPLPEISEEEIPFEIPESWEWVRLGDIGDTNIGLTYSPENVVPYGKGTVVLRSGNIQGGKLDYADLVSVNLPIPPEKYCEVGDILICARNGSHKLVGKSAIIDKEGMSFGAFMALYRSPCNNYVNLVISSPLFRKTFSNEVGTSTINQITQNMLKTFAIPLPPLAEQKRIVAKVEELMQIIDKL